MGYKLSFCRTVLINLINDAPKASQNTQNKTGYIIIDIYQIMP